MENGKMFNMNLHCIGDSHTAFFTGYNNIQPEYPKASKSFAKNIFTYRLGSSLAYNLCEPDSKTKSNVKLFEILSTLNCTTDIVLLSFGEVDCRAHVIKQAELKNITIDEAVHECVNRYLLVIKRILNLNFKVIVWNAVPTSMGFENVQMEYPYYGTFEERNKACILFNEELQKKSIVLGFYFIDVYRKIINKNFTTNNKYYFDKIHLSNKLLPSTINNINNVIPQFSITKIELLKIKIRILLKEIGIEKRTDKLINSIKKVFTKY
jgi:hypothetical protein